MPTPALSAALGRRTTTAFRLLTLAILLGASFAVTRPAMAAFTTATDLSAAGQNAIDPQVAIGADGTAAVVWSRAVGDGTYSVQVRVRTPTAASFGDVMTVDTSGQNSPQPVVAVAPGGAVTVAWRKRIVVNSQPCNVIMAATMPTNTSAFGSAEQLSSDTPDSDQTQIATGATGITTVVWQQDGLIRAATRTTVGSTFATAETISAATNADSPQIAIGADGLTTVVWRQPVGGDRIVRAISRAANASTFPDPSVAGNVKNVSLDSQGGFTVYANAPQLVMDPTGATTVVWRLYRELDAQGNTFTNIVQASTRASGSSNFNNPTNVSTAAEDTDNPQIGVAPDGSTTVVWSRSNGTNMLIQAATRAILAQGFGNPADLSGTGRNASEPQIGVGDDGSTIVVWKRSDGANTIIQGSTRTTVGGTFGTPEDLSGAGRNAEAPVIGVGADGSRVVAWQRSDGSNTVIQAVTDFVAPTPDPGPTPDPTPTPAPTPTPTTPSAAPSSSTVTPTADAAPKIEIVSAKTSKNKATVQVKVPSAGQVVVRGTSTVKSKKSRSAVRPAKKKATAAKTLKVQVKLNARTRAKLCRGKVTVQLRVTFRAKDGSTATETRSVTFKRISCTTPRR